MMLPVHTTSAPSPPIHTSSAHTPKLSPEPAAVPRTPSQLSAVALATSVHLLGSSRGAALPPVKELVDQYRR